MSTQAPSQPLLFLGDQRRRALTARVAEALRRWRQSWVRDAVEEFDVTVEPPAADGWTGAVAGVTTSVWALDAGAQRLAVLLLPHPTFAWAVQENGAASLDTSASSAVDSLAERLEQEVAHSLLAELCQMDRRDAATAARCAPEDLAAWSRETRAWTLHGRGSNGRGVTALLAASRVETLGPARAPQAGAALDSRREAVGGNAVALRAVVGEASMSVSELAELALDDVLVLDQSLAEPVMLVSPQSGARIAAGNLGRSGARRAIKLAGVAPRQD